MTEAATGLPQEEYRALTAAVAQLEQPSFVARLAQYAGAPVDAAIRYLPNTLSRRLRGVVNTAMVRCLDVAINSLEEEQALVPASEWTNKLITGLTGGVGGFFGMAALPFELPLTTTLMLRSIAEIARTEGEDIGTLDARLACLEVFALGGERTNRSDLSIEYYSVRAALSTLTRDLGHQMMERGAVNASSPIMARLIGEIVSRFGLAVTDRFALDFVPVIGAVGGATVNMIFMDHFQRVAHGHFTIRRLERVFGAEQVRNHYKKAAAALNGTRGPIRPETS